MRIRLDGWHIGTRRGQMMLDIASRPVNVVEPVSEPRGAITWGTLKNHEPGQCRFLNLSGQLCLKDAPAKAVTH